MNDFFAGIMASIKEHTLVWAGGAAVSALGVFAYARSHPMQPMAQNSNATTASDSSMSTDGNAANNMDTFDGSSGYQPPVFYYQPPPQNQTLIPPQPPPVVITGKKHYMIPPPQKLQPSGAGVGSGGPTYDEGYDHTTYTEGHVYGGPGRWLPNTEDLRSN